MEISRQVDMEEYMPLMLIYNLNRQVTEYIYSD